MEASETVEFVLFIIFVIVVFAALSTMCKSDDILKDPSETDGEFNCGVSDYI